jgi:hypothetical protein
MVKIPRKIASCITLDYNYEQIIITLNACHVLYKIKDYNKYANHMLETYRLLIFFA